VAPESPLVSVGEVGEGAVSSNAADWVHRAKAVVSETGSDGRRRARPGLLSGLIDPGNTGPPAADERPRDEFDRLMALRADDAQDKAPVEVEGGKVANGGTVGGSRSLQSPSVSPPRTRGGGGSPTRAQGTGWATTTAEEEMGPRQEGCGQCDGLRERLRCDIETRHCDPYPDPPGNMAGSGRGPTPSSSGWWSGVRSTSPRRISL